MGLRGLRAALVAGAAGAVIVASVLVAGCALAVAAPPALEVYGKDPEISSVALSPDGSQVAMLQVEEGRNPTLLIYNLATEKAKGYELGDLKVRDVMWSSDHHVLLFASKTTRIMQFRSSLVEYCGVFSINTNSKDGIQQLLVKNKDLALQSGLCSVEARLWNDTGDVLMAARVQGGSDATGEVALLRVNGDTGRGERLSRGTGATQSFVASPKGYVVARVDHAEKANRYRILIPTSEDRLREWKTAFAEETELARLSVYGANETETALIVGTYRKSGLFALFEMSLADGKLGKPLFEPDGVDVDNVITDPYTGNTVGASYVTSHAEQIFFQNDLQGVLMAVQKALKDYKTVQVVGWDRSRKVFLIFAEGPFSAGDYFTFDLNKTKLDHLSSQRRALRNDNIATVKSFFYKARDEMPIHAFVTLPLGLRDMDALKNAPLVVLPHGGPAARDSITFDYWAQALASRGYAVLQMNFRGSEGYGAEFRNLGLREWGGKMQDDVTDGVKYMIEKGIADPQRICIVGASYGGYAALAGAAFTPDLYKCAVSVAGVSDLGRFLGWQLNRYGVDSSNYEFWKYSLGDPNENSDLIKARSPARAAKAVTADVLLIHGKDDTIVPFEQSELMRDALKDAGKSVQLVKLDGEDHYLSRAKTRTEMLKALDGFLAKHIGAQTSASAN
jgi:dipeptidyl aminopeptidase/acylaminoacyl peptidase